MRISDWSSDVCSSDLFRGRDEIALRCRLALAHHGREQVVLELRQLPGAAHRVGVDQQRHVGFLVAVLADMQVEHELRQRAVQARELAAQHGEARAGQLRPGVRSEEHTPELQSLMRIPYAVFCLKKQNNKTK